MNIQRETFKKWIDECDNIVFFGGAGVSTESGIPDFRSQDGLYAQKYKYPPEQIVSHTFYVQKPKDFFEFYKDKMLAPDAEPPDQIGITARVGLGDLYVFLRYHKVKEIFQSEVPQHPVNVRA